MAELTSWHPTKEQLYRIFYGGEDSEENTYGDSPQDAINSFIKRYSPDELVGAIAGITHNAEITPAEFIRNLHAVLIPDADAAENNAFKTQDIQSINSNKTRLLVQNWLNANPTPYRWKIIFGHTTHKEIHPTPGIITFVKLSNPGGDTLSAHMILHTAGHAAASMIEMGNVEADLAAMINTIHTTNRVQLDNRNDRGDTHAEMVAICKLLHMRAAKLTIQGHPRGFPVMDEMINEIIGIYIKNGRIKIAPNEFCDYPITPAQCAAIKSYLEAVCKHALDGCVGQVIYDD